MCVLLRNLFTCMVAEYMPLCQYITIKKVQNEQFCLGDGSG